MARDLNPPSVIIHLSRRCEPARAEIEAGLEEEGIPCQVIWLEEDAADPLAAAHEAAKRSTLGVGVAQSSRGACLQLQGLPVTHPMVLHRGSVPITVSRRLGHDAGRLVKGLPLVSISLESQEQHNDRNDT